MATVAKIHGLLSDFVQAELWDKLFLKNIIIDMHVNMKFKVYTAKYNIHAFFY